MLSLIGYVMQNPKSLSELLAKGGNRLSQLQSRSAERAQILDLVKAVIPPKLAAAVASAGVEQGRLTIGVVGAVWASRLRYQSDVIKTAVGVGTGSVILTVRVKVVPPLEPM